MKALIAPILLFALGSFLASWGTFAVFYRRHPYDLVGALFAPTGVLLVMAAALAAFAPGFWSCG